MWGRLVHGSRTVRASDIDTRDCNVNVDAFLVRPSARGCQRIKGGAGQTRGAQLIFCVDCHLLCISYASVRERRAPSAADFAHGAAHSKNISRTVCVCVDTISPTFPPALTCRAHRRGVQSPFDDGVRRSPELQSVLSFS